MARSYAPEFRRRVVELVRSGRSVALVSAEIGVSEATVYRWRAQDRIDRGERPGLSSVERTERAVARRRIRELEAELEITKQSSATTVLAREVCPAFAGSNCATLPMVPSPSFRRALISPTLHGVGWEALRWINKVTSRSVTAHRVLVFIRRFDMRVGSSLIHLTRWRRLKALCFPAPAVKPVHLIAGVITAI